MDTLEIERMKNLKLPTSIPPESFTKPTRGAVIRTVTEHTSYISVGGGILPIDSGGYEIAFQVNLPFEYSGTAIQYGGSGFDGKLETAEGSCAGGAIHGPYPVEKGYVTFGSDGGHKGKPGIVWDASWSLNREALVNFAHESLCKTFDAAMYVVRLAYGKRPERTIFIGGSNGGREGLMAIRLYPENYDGAVILYPVLNWIGKALADHRNTNYITAKEERYIDRDDAAAINQILEGRQSAASPADRMHEKMKATLTNDQLAAFELFGTDMQLDYPLANGISVVPGYRIYEGARLRDAYFNQFGSAPGRRDGFMAQFSDAVVRYQIMQDPKYDPAVFDYRNEREKVTAASELLEATDPNLDAFFTKGGKMILLHGCGDQLVSMGSTVSYYESLKARYGKERLAEHLVFYRVADYGHGIGEGFTMSCEFEVLMDRWIRCGERPAVIAAKNQTPDRKGEVRFLRPEGCASLEAERTCYERSSF